MCYAKTYPALIKWSSCVLSVAHVFSVTLYPPPPSGQTGSNGLLYIDCAFYSPPTRRHSSRESPFAKFFLAHIRGMFAPKPAQVKEIKALYTQLAVARGSGFHWNLQCSAAKTIMFSTRNLGGEEIKAFLALLDCGTLESFRQVPVCWDLNSGHLVKPFTWACLIFGERPFGLFLDEWCVFFLSHSKCFNLCAAEGSAQKTPLLRWKATQLGVPF